MRILHISDLHFGAHNSDLAEDLKLRVANFVPVPDVILATGDLADQPDKALLKDARTYLEQLQSCCCKDDHAPPQLLVIPGNHDARYYGSYRWGLKYRAGASNYWQVFGDLRPDCYNPTENVWIYGFDSSLEFRTGANGRVTAKNLGQFHAQYKKLREEHGEQFDAAFKVIALHHHPAPIKYDDKQARWLTLTNAAEFLGEMLKNRVDLILHGHEHIRAMVRYGRRLRDDASREVPILSVGTALKKDPGEDRNCFYMIDIGNYSSSADSTSEGNAGLHNAIVTCYEADRNAFSGDPQKPFAVVSEADTRKKYLEVQKARLGYCYGEVSSIAKVNSDGDAWRIIECHDLQIEKKTPRASWHKISIPKTSGYIDKPRVRTIRGDGVNATLKRFEKQKEPESQSAEGLIEFIPNLNKGARISYQYSWWAVNSFALNQREAAFKYGDKRRDEFTHYPVHDPIDALTIIVQFPDDPALSPRETHPRVVNLRTAQEDAVVSAKLRNGKALRYYESLRTVALRVTKPLVGYSYGIQWPVPDSPPPPGGVSAGQLEDIIKALVRVHDNPTEGTNGFMKALLYTVADRLRKALIPNSAEKLEVGLMVFDVAKRRLIVVASAWIGTSPDVFKWQDYSKVEFRYGEGICGKAFKTNKPRLYAQLTEEESRARTTPDFYLRLAVSNHSALLGIPVQSPEVPSHGYAVIGCGASDRSSKLWELAQMKNPIDREDFQVLQSSLNELCFKLLKDEFLSQKTS